MRNISRKEDTTRTTEMGPAKIISDRLHKSRVGGIGDKPPQYHMSDFQKWSDRILPVVPDEVLNEQNQVAYHVLCACGDLANKYFQQLPRKNGPENEKNYAAFGYRAAAIIVEEFGINDPMVLATAYLAEAYIKLRIDDQKQFNDDLAEVFQNVDFTNQLRKNLLHFAQLETKYNDIATKIIADEDGVGTGEKVEKALDVGFTPASYEEFKALVSAIYIDDKSNETRYYTVQELFEYTANGCVPDASMPEQVGGLATMLTAMAQAIDKHRYPRRQSETETKLEIDVQNFRDALNVSYNLLPLARALDIPAPVRDLQRVVAEAMFPAQWNALQTALAEMSQSYSENDTPRIRRKSATHLEYFETQRKLNHNSLIKYINELFISKKVAATYVTESEFEKRKYNKLKSKSALPLLGPSEYTVLATSKKSAGSIFDKWLAEARSGKLNNERWTGKCAIGQEQEALTEEFKRPEKWREYMFGTTDPIRGTVVLGDNIADVTALSEIQAIQFQYLDEEKQDGVRTNHVRTNRVNPKNGKKLSERSEAQEFRVEPSDGFFEFHLLLLLNQENRGVQNVTYELHIESVKQHEENNFGTQLHILYKLKRNNGAQATHEEKEYLASLYRKIKEQLYRVTYGEAFE